MSYFSQKWEQDFAILDSFNTVTDQKKSKRNSHEIQSRNHLLLKTTDCVCFYCSGVGPNGRAVLHTIANNGGCSDKWGEMLKISTKEVDKELKRALKYKFQREDVPDPLETKYKYWDEGFW